MWSLKNGQEHMLGSLIGFASVLPFSIVKQLIFIEDILSFMTLGDNYLPVPHCFLCLNKR